MFKTEFLHEKIRTLPNLDFKIINGNSLNKIQKSFHIACNKRPITESVIHENINVAPMLGKFFQSR